MPCSSAMMILIFQCLYALGYGVTVLGRPT